MLLAKLKDKNKLIKGMVLVALCLFVAVFLIMDSIKASKSPAERTFTSMGMDTIISCSLQAQDAEGLEDEIKGIIDSVAGKIDRFDVASAVSRANSTLAVELDGEQLEWYRQIFELQQLSGGALDCSLGNISALWDFNSQSPRLPKKSDIERYLDAERGFSLEHDELVLRQAGSLDLGAVGKGIACDAVAAALSGKSQRVVLSVGGSVLLFGDGEFSVGIHTPGGAAGECFATIKMSAGFVSTSGSYERYFELDGKRYHHILDPKTGYPAETGIVSVTVIASGGLTADGLSTACFVLGYEKSKSLLEKYGASAVFVDEDKRVFVYPESTGGDAISLGEGLSLEITDENYKLAAGEGQ
ncbi:MAG: FAD:protein FMN transferase [Clostridium sp.]|jgi:thiamine biosynthesis lipoprotein|nr:FAD:protein FMN transferase [Clostridium sp.]